jgi:hypothetical protein
MTGTIATMTVARRDPGGRWPGRRLSMRTRPVPQPSSGDHGLDDVEEGDGHQHDAGVVGAEHPVEHHQQDEVGGAVDDGADHVEGPAARHGGDASGAAGRAHRPRSPDRSRCGRGPARPGPRVAPAEQALVELRAAGDQHGQWASATHPGPRRCGAQGLGDRLTGPPDAGLLVGAVHLVEADRARRARVLPVPGHQARGGSAPGSRGPSRRASGPRPGPARRGAPATGRAARRPGWSPAQAARRLVHHGPRATGVRLGAVELAHRPGADGAPGRAGGGRLGQGRDHGDAQALPPWCRR